MPGTGTAFGPRGQRRLGPFEIHEMVGEGGMGEVYRATDTRLERTVAIKILPEHFASVPERRERFEREARAVSKLNHPHICTLYDIGEQGGTHYLVMEFVEGEDLEARLTRGGALPLKAALEYAIQIADALDRAHRNGVVHRDLKPANVMITRSGVKLLDFGLAKFREDQGLLTAVEGSQAPTVEKPLTGSGTIVGTVQYMAPEQLEGKPTDSRTDLFALGTIVYEMVSGRKTFSGESQASLISSIMVGDPAPVSKFQPLAPRALEHFIATCLEKDPENRWQTTHDAKVQLKWIAAGEAERLEDPKGTLVEEIVSTQVRTRTWSVIRRLALGVVALVVLAGWLGWALRQPPSAYHGAFVLSAAPSEPVMFGGTSVDMAISPDGNTVVYATEREGQFNLYARPVDALEGRLLPVGAAGTPFFSPDGGWIGFNDLNDGSLRRVPTNGTTVETITPIEGTARGATWGPDDTIVFATSDTSTGLLSVPLLGGPVQTLTSPGPGEDHLWPQFIADGRAILLTIRRGMEEGNSSIAVFDRERGITRELIAGASTGRYAGTGHLIYAIADELWARAFDASSLTVTGDPVRVHEGILATSIGAAPYSFSEDGHLAFFGGTPLSDDRELAFVDPETGDIERLPAEPMAYLHPRVSPDGNRIAAQVDLPDGASDVYLYERGSDASIRQLTQGGNNIRPIWKGNNEVTFASDESGVWAIYSQPIDGFVAGEPLLSAEPGVQLWPESWSPDSRTLSFVKVEGEARGIWLLSENSNGQWSETVFLDDPEFLETGSVFSPDGRWIAYHEDSNDYNVWMRRFPQGDAAIPLSGGVFPTWSEDGSELLYRKPQGAADVVGAKLLKIEVFSEEGTAGERVERLLPVEDFSVIPTHRDYDIAPDGRVLVAFSPDEAERHVYIMTHWFEVVRERTAP